MAVRKKQQILFYDKEIICLFEEGKKQARLRYNDIQSVSIKPYRERKGLKGVQSERIIIRSFILPRPLEYYKFKEAPFFDDYKAGFRLFCKTNRVTIHDEIPD